MRETLTVYIDGLICGGDSVPVRFTGSCRVAHQLGR